MIGCMYRTCMSADALAQIDAALLALRRFVEPPAVVDHEGRRVEVSTVLVLDALSDVGQATVTDVAEHLSIAHSTASRLVTRAVEAGMVSRQPSRHDSRAAVLEATPAGRRLHRAASRFRRQRLEHTLQSWSERDRAQLANLLRRFTTALT
jgi:DNA-binding MarR family transcriptional regulator